MSLFEKKKNAKPFQSWSEPMRKVRTVLLIIRMMNDGLSANRFDDVTRSQVRTSAALLSAAQISVSRPDDCPDLHCFDAWPPIVIRRDGASVCFRAKCFGCCVLRRLRAIRVSSCGLLHKGPPSTKRTNYAIRAIVAIRTLRSSSLPCRWL